MKGTSLFKQTETPVGIFKQTVQKDTPMLDEDEKPAESGTGGLVLTTCFKLAINGESRLTTGCDILTDFFRGGLVPKKLYEIFGPILYRPLIGLVSFLQN